MPELPEVETSRRGIAPALLGHRVECLIVRCRQLRWPVPDVLDRDLPGQRIDAVRRRAKYLLIDVATGSAVMHLGMSGHVCITDAGAAPGKHDHVDIVLDDGNALRFTDPRRFGCLLWQPAGVTLPLLTDLGPEPLSDVFDGDYLWQRARGRHVPVKNFIMNQHVVVGVGNIYASEALFLAGIHPARAAGHVSRSRYDHLAMAIRRILERAIAAGGTTLQDFIRPDGQPGWFEQQLAVYGRSGLPCPHCGTAIRALRIGQRNTFYCPHCQH